MGRQTEADRAADFGYLFNDQDVFNITHAGSAVFFRNDHTHESKLAHGTHDLNGKMLDLVPFHYMRFDILCCKIPGSSGYLPGNFV